MFPFLGGLASGALGLLGSSMNASAQNSINQQMLAMQAQQNAVTNEEWQQSFGANQAQTAFSNAFNTAQFGESDWLARNGVQARVADAKAAGISPLAALGMQPISGPSVAVSGGSPPAPAGGGVPSLTAPSPGAGVASLGQDISRALQSAQDPDQKAVSAIKTQQDLEKGDLENELLKSQIYGSAVSRHSAVHTGPGITDQEVMVARGPEGQQTSGPTKPVEGWSWVDPWAKTQWLWRNQIEPAFGYNIPKQVDKAAAGFSKYKNPLTGVFYDFPSASDIWKRVYKPSTYTRSPGDISP